MTFADVVERLESSLGSTLPGDAAHAHLAPRPRRPWPPGFDLADIRHAAGLLLVVPAESRARIVLTVRAETLGRHRGQVSLPGGVIETGESREHAALREAHEEIGLAVEEVRLLGALTPLDIPVSGFRLHPIVACTNERPALAPADGEVARIVEVGVDDLLTPASITTISREVGGAPADIPVFRLEGVEIWGATAMILAEFLTLLGWNGTDR